MAYEEIHQGIYYVGDATTKNGLDCNAYLLIDGNDAILFDPGSVLEFEQIVQNIRELIPLERINYMVLHHQDPDVCSNVHLFEELGLHFNVVTSWRTMTLVQYYGIQSPYYLLEEHAYQLTLESGRKLQFIQTPYLHFPGAFVTYDPQTKSLLSSDLFGAFSFNRTLYADETYLGKMLTFHEHYMPSNTVLRPVMDTLLSYDIQMIMPQHGSVIKDDVKSYIHVLRTLECGSLLSPVRKNLKENGGFLAIFNDVFQRYQSLYEPTEVMVIFKEVPGLNFDENGVMISYSGNPEEVWDEIFKTIERNKGMIWVSVVEPFVRTLSATYDIGLPEIMKSLIESAQIENQRLMEMNVTLEQTIKSVNEKLVRCPITGLYNETFLKSLLVEELDREDWRDIGALATVGIDNFSKYKWTYGVEEEQSVLRNIAYMLKGAFGENAVFRMETADFALYLKSLEKSDIIEKLDSVRMAIEKSRLFLGDISVSLGVTFNNELNLDDATYEMTAENYLERALNRLRVAKLRGQSYLVYETDAADERKNPNSVLIVDYDQTNLEVLKNFIGELDVEVHIATDGFEALEKAEKYVPSIIITEVNMPKMDGFVLKEELAAHSHTKDIEVVFLSYIKDEILVRRANELGVMHYLRKPYLLAELLGIVKRQIRG